VAAPSAGSSHGPLDLVAREELREPLGRLTKGRWGR